MINVILIVSAVSNMVCREINKCLCMFYQEFPNFKQNFIFSGYTLPVKWHLIGKHRDKNVIKKKDLKLQVN